MSSRRMPIAGVQWLAYVRQGSNVCGYARATQSVARSRSPCVQARLGVSHPYLCVINRRAEKTAGIYHHYVAILHRVLCAVHTVLQCRWRLEKAAAEANLKLLVIRREVNVLRDSDRGVMPERPQQGKRRVAGRCARQEPQPLLPPRRLLEPSGLI